MFTKLFQEEIQLEGQLKPCPRCGGAGALKFDWAFDGFTVQCCNCEETLPNVFPSAKQAVQAWNGE